MKKQAAEATKAATDAAVKAEAEKKQLDEKTESRHCSEDQGGPSKASRGSEESCGSTPVRCCEATRSDKETRGQEAGSGEEAVLPQKSGRTGEAGSEKSGTEEAMLPEGSARREVTDVQKVSATR